MKQVPATLSPESKRIWKNLVKKYDFLPSEYPTLQLSLKCWDEIQMMEAMLKKHGYFIQDKDKKIRPHPATRILKESRLSFLRGWKALGFKSEDDLHRGPGRPPNADARKFELP